VEFLPRLRLAGRRVLDLGCGPGLDAAFLAARGFSVTGLDRERPGRAVTRSSASFVRGDLRIPPFREVAFDAVSASLSLHYLSWAATVDAFAQACRLVRPHGVFLCRVNASDDVAHGAGQGEELEPGFFRLEGRVSRWSETKRFFDEAMVRAALPPTARVEHLSHRTIHRGDDPKRVWVCLARVL
jgi:SAM-dependent methyltransferase